MNTRIALRMLPLFLGSLLLAGCGNSEPDGTTGHDPAKTGLEYGPDMYHSLPLEPYAQMDYHAVNPNGQNLRQPAQGSIARGKMYGMTGTMVSASYPYPATNDGYEAAGRELTNPIPYSAEAVAEGKRLYELNCVHCHGTNGNGQGKVSAGGGGPFAGVPSYIDGPLLDLPDGKMFHTITYGKNLMGSHATQLNPSERWLVIHYINELQNKATGKGGANAANPPAGAASTTGPAQASGAAVTPSQPAK